MLYRSKKVFLTQELILASAKQYEASQRRLKKPPGDKVIRVVLRASRASFARTPMPLEVY